MNEQALLELGKLYLQAVTLNDVNQKLQAELKKRDEALDRLTNGNKTAGDNS